ncbi:MAG: glycosyltransferase [Planctomycetota bacterium]
MRILHVIASVNPKGGGPIEGTRLLSAAHGALGHCVEIASLDDPNASFLKDFPFKLHAFGPAFLVHRYSSRIVPWLKAHATDYDAVIVNGLWNYSSLAVWRALRNAPTPYFVFTHGMLDPWFKFTHRFKHFKKWLYWPWGDYRVLRDARAVLFTSEEERILARQSFWLYRCNEIVVGSGTARPVGDAAAQREAFLARFPELREKRLWLFLSRIHLKKGCDLLIEAFAHVAAHDEKLRLIMAGPNPIGWQSILQARATKLGIAHRITWPGMLTGDLKWGAFRAAEVFILPSHSENFGTVVTEALACGVPTLISNKVNIWREIIAAGAGLAANDDLAGTIELLEHWLTLSPEQQAAMRAKTKKCFDEHFEISLAANKLISVLRANGVKG